MILKIHNFHGIIDNFTFYDFIKASNGVDKFKIGVYYDIVTPPHRLNIELHKHKILFINSVSVVNCSLYPRKSG
jgi:hypothetical protein